MEQKTRDQEIEAAHIELAKEYFTAALSLLGASGSRELNYCKRSIEFDNGSIYLLGIFHVAGPKLDPVACCGAEVSEGPSSG